MLKVHATALERTELLKRFKKTTSQYYKIAYVRCTSEEKKQPWKCLPITINVYLILVHFIFAEVAEQIPFGLSAVISTPINFKEM